MNQIKYWIVSAVSEIFLGVLAIIDVSSGTIENVKKKKKLFNPIYWVNVFIKPFFFFFFGDSFF